MEPVPITPEDPVKVLGKSILASENPASLIQQLSPQDYFQIIKTLDENEVMPLLESGSPDQWQCVLDLELWDRDHLDPVKTSRWLHLLYQADSRQLIQWLLDEGESLGSYFLSRTVEVEAITEPNEAKDLPEGFFSLDGHFYLRFKDPGYGENLVDILRTIAVEDYEKYQNLLLELESVIPAELEEELYRLRNIRLAEQGFLPFEEALAVYTPLEPAALKVTKSQAPLIELTPESESLNPVPLLPLAQTRTRNQFLEVAAGIRDPFLLGKLRLEFAGLANQILAADRFTTFETEALIRACDRAARLINLAIEKVCGRDLNAIEDLLRQNSLVTLFQVGFGLVQKIKWEAERWRKNSWFHRQGLGTSFWGERGKALDGLLKKRPNFYAGSQSTEPYRDFERLSDLRESLEVLQSLMVMDGLLKKMAARYPLPEALPHRPETTFYTLLFNFWARQRLHLETSFSGLSLGEAKRFLSELQGPSPHPPFIGENFRTVFINDLMAQTAGADPQAAALLEMTLGRIWDDFQEDYGRISSEELDPRFFQFLTIEP